MIVLSYREGEVDHGRTPLGDVLGVLKDGDFERISLRGLTLSEVGEYARGCAGRPLSDALVRVLFEETVGNPFYVREVIRLLADEGALARAATSEDVTMRHLGVPRGVREVIAKRFARLAEPAARVLRIAAATPEPSGLALLDAVSELDEGKLRVAITGALGSGLLRRTEDDRYEASHALVRRVIHDAIQPDLRVRLHRRIAESLEASGERRPGLEALIAGEYQASSAIAGAELGVPHAVEAAHEAAAAGAQERAVSFLRRARSLASSAPPHVRAEALCELALAEARALHPESAVRSTEDALAALEETGAGTEEIAAFLSEVAREMKSGSAPASCWAPLVERALVIANGSRTLTWARLALMVDRFEPLAYGAVNLARALPRDVRRDPARAPGRGRRRLRRDARRRPADARRSGAARADGCQMDSSHRAPPRPRRGRPRALLPARGIRGRARARGNDAQGGQPRGIDPRAGGGARPPGDLRRGARSDRPVDRRARARAGARDAGGPLVPGDPRSLARPGCDARVLRGRRLARARGGRGARDVRSHRASSPAGHVAAAIASLAYTLGGHAREARSLLGHLAGIFERCDARLYHYGVALGCATTAVWHLGARDLAEKYRALERGAPPLAGAAPYASRDVNLGRMAVLLEEWEEAREHMKRADVLLARRRLRPLHAIALHDGAAAVLRSGDEAEGPRARAKLAASLRTFRVLGMEPWIDHAHRLLDLPRPSYPDGLTSREVEILAMIGEGQAVEGIASALGVAAPAARKETARACAKIGARGRRAAAAYAIDHRFVAPAS